MRKGILLLFLFTVFFANAQTTVTTTAGNLQTALNGQTGITQLTINGTLNAKDFAYIKNAYSLVSLDLSGVTAIEAYNGPDGPESNVTDYAANEFPERGMYLEPSLTTVILPNNGAISSIGKEAFASASSLTTFNIPASVTNIKEYAFFNCTALTGTLNIAATVTTLGQGAFYGTGYTSAVLPEGLAAIPDSLLANCTNLNSITIPSTVTSIGNRVFRGCSSLTSVDLPEGLLTLGGSETFAETAITTLVIPPNAQFLNGLMYSTFNFCESLTSVNIPLGTATIDFGTFAFTAIPAIVVPEGVTTIGQAAFANMPNLTTLELPSTLVNIGPYAFGGLSALTSLKVNNPVPVILSQDQEVFSDTDQTTVILYVPAGTLAAYDAADIWTNFLNMEEFGEAATLEVSSNTFTVAQAGESVVVDITTNLNWEAGANFNWLILSAASGSGNATLVLTAAPNTTGAERTAIVEVSAPGVESQIITVTQSATMGGEDFNKLNVQVYPNPATDVITISGLQALAGLELMNVNGSAVAKGTISDNGTFSVAALPAGFYFARITSDGKTAIHKIIKK